MAITKGGVDTDAEFEARNIPRKNATYFLDDNEWAVLSVRIGAKRVEALRKHFKLYGDIPLTTGIRQALYEWMDEKGVH